MICGSENTAGEKKNNRQYLGHERLEDLNGAYLSAEDTVHHDYDKALE